MHTNKHQHTHRVTVEGHCVLSGEFHRLFTRVTAGKFMTVLDKTINTITLAHTHTHAELLSYVFCVFEDNRGLLVGYINRAK